ncbi:nuclear transport factor 2 family protein [Allobranchiibius sp. GilTou73]|uniref:nuclear transport factor 2 family protein n=1 Tax=Allobranchiibius sp. GilTou73 TaxID=2904523 RepID=UPI001F387152|nr:nuclear transport factor 2 family protein [Allobranchiibius sp. GilTou73]UIJ35834.1 nuclear transport factor 2 family protein [Allobranchiibius sp. GilTou73]
MSSTAGTAPGDLEAIDEIVRVYFDAFTSGPDVVTRLARMRTFLLPEAVIVRTCGMTPAVYDVEGFIAPRRELLTSGALVDFREWEVSGRTEIFGDIAQRWSTYAKAGVQQGVPFTGRGAKTLQFVRTPDGWRISAAAWDDERDGLRLDEEK